MLLPLMLATALLLSGLLAYGAAMQLIVRVMVKLIRRGPCDLGFWKGTAVMAIVTLIMAIAHLTQIALWAVAFLLCGQVSTLETAFCLSAQNFTAFGYGDVMLSERWRLPQPARGHQRPSVFRNVGPAVLFAIMSELISRRLRAETGYMIEAAGKDTPLSATGGCALFWLRGGRSQLCNCRDQGDHRECGLLLYAARRLPDGD